MQFILKPVNDPAAPYGETRHPLFVDSLEEAKEEAERILRLNKQKQTYRLFQCFMSGDRNHCGDVKIDSKKNTARWSNIKHQ